MLAFSPRVSELLQSTEHQVVVTGVGGWLGAATLEMFESALGDAFERRIKAYASYPRGMTLRSGRTVAVRALSDLAFEPPASSFVLHYAYLGKEKVAQLGIEKFISTNAEISSIVEAYCKRLHEGGLFFASSGAAQFAEGCDQDPDREPYGAAKVRDEARFLALSRSEFPVVCCRVFNMSGPYINKLNDYVLSCIVRDIQKGGPIRLRAAQPVLRSFVHVRDIVDLAVSLMLKGVAPDGPFDTSGTEVIEVGELALRAAQVLGRPDTLISRPLLIEAGEDRYVGRAQPFKNLLSQMGISPRGLDVQIRDTAEYVASLNVPPDA